MSKLQLVKWITLSIAFATFAVPLTAWAYAMPSPNLTPGTLCTPSDPNFAGYDYPEHIARCNRNVNDQEKMQIAAEYGNIPRSEWRNYEFDHFIPLCAGGSDDIRNLWPQPINDAHQKDKLEYEVCREMRAGTSTQQEAVAKIRAFFGVLGAAGAENTL